MHRPQGLCGSRCSALVLVVAFGLGIWVLARRTPTGFLPEEDQGAFFVEVQLPDGASVARTAKWSGRSKLS